MVAERNKKGIKNGLVKMGELFDIYKNNKIIYQGCDKNWVSLALAGRLRRAGHHYGGGGHCYIECVYEDLFKNYKERQGNLLEVGIERGMSLLLWHLYFSKMTIHGIDDASSDFCNIEDLQQGIPKEITIEQFDTTDLSPSLKEYVEKNLKKFDIIIDDGDHRWRSQFQTAINLFPILKDDGIYIIEDIEYPAELEQAVVAVLNPHIKIHDNRDVTNQKDEVIFEIRKKI